MHCRIAAATKNDKLRPAVHEVLGPAMLLGPILTPKISSFCSGACAAVKGAGATRSGTRGAGRDTEMSKCGKARSQDEPIGGGTEPR